MVTRVFSNEFTKHCYSSAICMLKQCYLHCSSNIKEKKRKDRKNARRVPARDALRVVRLTYQARSFFGSFFVENFFQRTNHTVKTAIQQVMNVVFHNLEVVR